ncbi:deoxyribodipyrimidine photo-lyase [Agarivorans sp. QJM3NY_33]|uniref:deoxyribodipyrimidine photo-lyase n=1 Tax=Agarivorans sp. QJM3NY_33 TaxID=3421432 RepID=UPI003D7D1C86
MATHLVWFRNDLRIKDNQALSTAIAEGGDVLAIYIGCPEQWQAHAMAPIQADLIGRRLQVLQRELAALNIPLVLRECPHFSDVPQCLTELCQQYQIVAAHSHYQYELNEQRRDQACQQQLLAVNVRWCQYHGECGIAPGSLKTQAGNFFKVFTPFRKAWLAHLSESELSPLRSPTALVSRRLSTGIRHLLAHSAAIPDINYPRVDSSAWAVDDEAIITQLRQFSASQATTYKQLRDFPAEPATSKLSAYLALGMLSPRQCLARLLLDHPHCLVESEGGAFCWLSEIIWREFYRHLLAANPRLSMSHAFIGWTEAIPWHENQDLLKAWQQGQTGYPIVDAAMRQLNQTGWMHNRLRMIVASFLSKDLLLNWRLGERWFMQHLIDGDFASNNGGWQWAASTGTDAQPYFRIFNPTTQGQRFDPEGKFVRQWVPELADIPGKYVHQPHAWANKNKRYIDYPLPVVNHAEQRQLILGYFEQAKNFA